MMMFLGYYSIVVLALSMLFVDGFSVQNSNNRVFVSTPASKSPKYIVADYMDPIQQSLKSYMSVDETLQIFIKDNLSAAPVTDDDNNLVGIVSSFDFLQKEAFEGALLPMGGSQELIERYVEAARKICGRKVEDIMSSSPNLTTVTMKTSMREAAAIMAEKRLHRLPVIDSDNGGKLVGMLTTAHIMKDLGHVLERLPAAASNSNKNESNNNNLQP